MAMEVHRSDTAGITQWGMSTATLEATGHRHQATLAPYHPSGRQGNNKKQQSNNTPTFLVVLMAIAMQRYNTACIA
jgi:hypothetical protein